MARRVTLYSKDGEVGVVFYSLKRKGDKLIIDARALDAMRMTLVLTRGEAFGMLRMMLGRAVVSFVTGHILEAGRIAVIETGDDNRAMAATAKSVGFQHVSLDRVWWTYPETPDTSGTVNGKGKNDHGPR